MNARAQVAIIGSGISGLSAAYEFDRRNIPVVVFERGPRAGGVVLTERVSGYTIDAGPDALLTQKPAAINLCQELGLGERLAPPRRREILILRGGRLRQLPDASIFGIPTRWMPFVTTGAFSFTGKLRMAAECVIAAQPQQDESIASFMHRRFGSEAMEYLAEPLLAGIHGGDASRLSMRALFPRLLDLEKTHGSVIRGLRQAPRPSVAASPFLALPNGMSELTDALVAALPPGALRLGVGVETIERAGAGFALTLTTGERVTLPQVLIAAPPASAARLLKPLDDGLAKACSRIRMASVVTVAVGYSRASVRHPLAGAGCVVPRRENLSIRALSWVSSKWAGRAPADRVLLRASLGGALDPAVIDLDDTAIVDRVLRDLRTLLGVSATPELIRVYRWPHAVPQLELGHGPIIKRIDDQLAAQPGLFMSATGFRATGIADCVADARAQAAAASHRFALTA